MRCHPRLLLGLCLVLSTSLEASSTLSFPRLNRPGISGDSIS